MVENIDKYDEEMFLEYVEGELPIDRRIAFEKLMLEDPRLRNLVAQMVLDRHRLRTMPDEQPPEGLMDVVNERLERAMLLGGAPESYPIHARVAARSRFRWGRLVALSGVAAMFLAVAGVFVITLVQLANDAPIQTSGLGTIVPPGLAPVKPGPGASLLPDAGGQTGDVHGDDKTSSPEAIAGGANTAATVTEPAGVEHTAQQTTKQTTQGETRDTTAMANAAAGQTDTQGGHVVVDGGETKVASTDGQRIVVQAEALPRLPAADVVFVLEARDVEATQRRLTAWAAAYDVNVLDVRQLYRANDDEKKTSFGEPASTPAVMPSSDDASSGSTQASEETGTLDKAAAVKVEAEAQASVAGAASDGDAQGANQAIALDTPAADVASSLAESVATVAERGLVSAEMEDVSRHVEAKREEVSVGVPLRPGAVAITLRMKDMTSTHHLQTFLHALPGVTVRGVESDRHLSENPDWMKREKLRAAVGEEVYRAWMGKMLQPSWLRLPLPGDSVPLPFNNEWDGSGLQPVNVVRVELLLP